MSSKPKVLITGAAGRIARRIIPLLRSQFSLKLTDRSDGSIDGIPVTALDITDYKAVREIVPGVDAILHLAIASSREFVTDVRQFEEKREGDEYLCFNQATIDVNLRGTYNIYEAARSCQVERVIFGSSLTVLMGAPEYPEYSDDLPARPANFYAVSKLWGEQLGEFFSRVHGLRVYGLRIGSPHPQPEHPQYPDWLADSRTRSVFVTYRDIANAVRCALTTKGPPFGLYTVVSAKEESCVSVAKGEEIGWQPEDFCRVDGTVVSIS